MSEELSAIDRLRKSLKRGRTDKCDRTDGKRYRLELGVGPEAKTLHDRWKACLEKTYESNVDLLQRALDSLESQ